MNPPTPPPLPRERPADLEEMVSLFLAARKAKRRDELRRNAEGRTAGCESIGELLNQTLNQQQRGGGK